MRLCISRRNGWLDEDVDHELSTKRGTPRDLLASGQRKCGILTRTHSSPTLEILALGSPPEIPPWRRSWRKVSRRCICSYIHMYTHLSTSLLETFDFKFTVDESAWWNAWRPLCAMFDVLFEFLSLQQLNIVLFYFPLPSPPPRKNWNLFIACWSILFRLWYIWKDKKFYIVYVLQCGVKCNLGDVTPSQFAYPHVGSKSYVHLLSKLSNITKSFNFNIVKGLMSIMHD